MSFSLNRMEYTMPNAPTIASPLQINEPYAQFKERILSELPSYTKKQEHSPSYKRERLLPLEKGYTNLSVRFDYIPEGIQYFANSFTFYGYNAEGVRDYGWGCAWRVIQTCLSAYDKQNSFLELFHLFGIRENLVNIYQNKYPDKQLNTLKTFAPYDLSNGWAEPFIGHMVMHFYNIPSALESVNGVPGCNAPKEVFHNDSLTFSNFKKRIQAHFENKNASPIMIDDGEYSLNIVGVGTKESDLILWIVDPHIKEGVNNELKTETINGSYTVTLNELGEQKDCSLYNKDAAQVQNMFNKDSYQGLHFKEKHWMVLFPMQN